MTVLDSAISFFPASRARKENKKVRFFLDINVSHPKPGFSACWRR